jgi:RNA-binding protein YhbY
METPTSYLTQYQPSNKRRLHLLEKIDDGDDYEGDEEDEESVDDFFVSPEQISFLRKEASKREARNKLPRYNLSTSTSSSSSQVDNDGEKNVLSDETINSISNLFEQSELIEVRGVSKNSKRKVHETAHALASTLEDIYETPVVVVEIKGFAVKLYRPWSCESDDEDEMMTMREGQIQLRTNYKPGQWTRKAKPIRDIRGQIITDEYGNSVKEIPED